MSTIIPKDSNNCIRNGLRADIMRKSIENKNLLSQKGSMYVGTGTVVSTVIGGDTFNIPITAELSTQEQGQILADTVLVCQSSAPCGLQYQKITPDQVEHPYSSGNLVSYPINTTRAQNAEEADTADYALYVTYTNSTKTETVESKLSNLEKDIYETSIPRTTFSFNNVVIGDVSVSSLYKETTFSCITLRFSLLSNIPLSGVRDFYSTANASVSTTSILPIRWRPKNNFVFYIERDGLYYTESSTTTQYSVPIEVTITTNGSIVLTNKGAPKESLFDNFRCNGDDITVTVYYPRTMTRG